MKLKVGNKLFGIREDRKLNQEEMAELLGVSKSSYSRIERGETSLELDQLIRFSDLLGVPVHEMLPETISLTNNNHQQNGQGGQVVFGDVNFHYYAENGKELASRQKEIESLKKELSELKKALLKKGE